MTNHSHSRGLVPLSELPDFKVADGYTDIRGFTAYVDADRRVGEVDQLLVDTAAERVAAITLDVDRDLLDTGREPRVEVPIEHVEIDTPSRRVFVQSAGVSYLGMRGGASTHATTGVAHATPAPAPQRTSNREEERLTLAEEELSVGKRQVQAGEVEVSKRVETERVREDVTLRHDEVEVERRPVTNPLAADATIGGEEEIRVPLHAEEAVIEKRVVPKEELVIRKRQVSENEVVEADVRSEHAEVHREGAVRETDDLDRDRTRRDGGI